MADVRIAILMCEWGTPVPGASATRWSKSLVHEVFQARNGWSIGSWWDACSLGHRKPQFEVFEAGTLQATQETLDRATLHARVVDLARSKGIAVDTFQHHVAFVQPNPNPAGAIGGGAVLDRDATHQYYEHEIGHVLGFDHAWGFGPGFSAIEYGDDFCAMGNFARWHAQPPAALSAPDLAAIGQPLWRYGVQPSAASLFRYCQEFRNSTRVHTLAAGTNGLFNLAALSEPQLDAPLLYRIPVDDGQDFLVEYRAPTGWDRGIGTPTLVIHSLGLPSRTDHTPMQRGMGHPWFEKAIPLPFQDAWWYHNPSIGIEVVGRWSEDKALTLKVTSPADVKSASLQERAGRTESSSFPPETGIVWLNRDVDPMLCDEDLHGYGVTIERFGEDIELDVVASGFQTPVVDEWRVGYYVIGPATPPGMTFTVPTDLTSTHIERPAPQALPRLVKHTVTGASGNFAQMRLTPRSGGATLSSVPGGNAFVVHVEALVRDAALDPGIPSARRVASADVAFVGERIVWDDDYKDAVEACWVRRIQGRVRYLPRYEPGPLQPPPWLDRTDRQLIRRVEERLAARGGRIRDKPNKT